jgi:hypothetical protein
MGLADRLVVGEWNRIDRFGCEVDHAHDGWTWASRLTIIVNASTTPASNHRKIITAFNLNRPMLGLTVDQLFISSPIIPIKKVE